MEKTPNHVYLTSYLNFFLKTSGQLHELSIISRKNSVENAEGLTKHTDTSALNTDKSAERYLCINVCELCGLIGTSRHITALYNMDHVVLCYQQMSWLVQLA